MMKRKPVECCAAATQPQGSVDIGTLFLKGSGVAEEFSSHAHIEVRRNGESDIASNAVDAHMHIDADAARGTSRDRTRGCLCGKRLNSRRLCLVAIDTGTDPNRREHGPMRRGKRNDRNRLCMGRKDK